MSNTFNLSTTSNPFWFFKKINSNFLFFIRQSLMSPEIRTLELSRQGEEILNIEKNPNDISNNSIATTKSTDSDTEYDNEISKVQEKLDVDDPDFVASKKALGITRANIRPNAKIVKKSSKYYVSPILKAYDTMPVVKRKPGDHFTDDQLKILKDMYKLTSFPNRAQRLGCAVSTGLKIKAVNSWYI